MEKIYFNNPAGEVLSGIIEQPYLAAKVPIVVMAHGFGSKKNNKTNLSLTERFLEKGVGTFRFDFSGHGESEGKIEELTVTKGIGELKAAMEKIEHLEWVNRTRLGFLGGSFGGNVELLYVARFGGVKALALKSPISNYKEVRELQLGSDRIQQWARNGSIELSGGIRSDFHFYEDASRIDTYAEARNVRCPVFIVQGDHDEDIPMSHARALESALGTVHMEVIQGADHGYTNPEHFARMIGLLERFLLESL